jgi:RNA polymerase sigma factor (sigma-70 family)
MNRLHKKYFIDWEKDFKMLYPMLYQIAKRLTNNVEEAKDIPMECIRKMLELKDPPFKNFNEAKGFLIVCVKNMCITYLRKQTVKDKEEKNLIAEMDISLNDIADAELALAALKQAIKNEIYRQPERRRQVLILFYYHSKKRDEISGLLKISTQTVNNLLTKGRKVLRRKFGDMDIWIL